MDLNGPRLSWRVVLPYEVLIFSFYYSLHFYVIVYLKTNDHHLQQGHRWGNKTWRPAWC